MYIFKNVLKNFKKCINNNSKKQWRIKNMELTVQDYAHNNGYITGDELIQHYNSLLIGLEVEDRKYLMGLSIEEIKMLSSWKTNMIQECLNKFNNEFKNYIENKKQN